MIFFVQNSGMYALEGLFCLCVCVSVTTNCTASTPFILETRCYRVLCGGVLKFKAYCLGGSKCHTLPLYTIKLTKLFHAIIISVCDYSLSKQVTGFTASTGN